MRTTPEDVRKIIELDATLDVIPFIEMASDLITEVCGDVGYTEDRMVMLENLLTAHLCTMLEPRVTSESVSTLQERVATRIGFGLNHSVYGQMLLRFDTAGGFAALELQTRNGPGGGIAGISFVG